MNKRIGIFLFFNANGVVYDYVTYLLKGIAPCLDRLVIVCNGYVGAEGLKTLEGLSDTVVIRPNAGFDFAAWREGILDVCGIDHVREYDELLLFNDSYFGPLYPFSEVFAKMDAQEDIDFWGLSSHGAAPRKVGPDRPRYLQTYFLCFRKKMMQSDQFYEYWRDLPSCSTFSEHVETIASMMTETFASMGYRWTAYAPTFDLECDDPSRNVSHHMYDSLEMVKNRKLPIIKRKTFIMPYGAFMRFSDGTVLSDTLDYIERETDYDTGLIWDYLLANCNLKVLLDDLCLSRVLPAAFASQDNPAKGSAAVFAHLFYEDLFEESLGVLQRVPERVDVYATTSSPEKKEALEALARERGFGRLQVLLVDNRGRDISALLVGCREYVSRYEYACFWHDKKTAHNQYPQSGRCFADMLTECTLASRAYVENVLTEFEAHPRLGLVVPEAPYHGVNYRFAAGSYWASDFDQTMAVMSRLGLEVPMAASQDCPALGTAFWFRVAALKPLFDYPWKLSDFPPNPMPTDGSISHGIERVFPYVAQAEGYYTERAMPDTLARAVADDCRYMLNATVDATVENEDIPLLASTYFQFVTSLKESTRVLKMPYRRQRIRDAYVALSRLFPPVKKLKNYIRTHAKGLWRRF